MSFPYYAAQVTYRCVGCELEHKKHYEKNEELEYPRSLPSPCCTYCRSLLVNHVIIDEPTWEQIKEMYKTEETS